MKLFAKFLSDDGGVTAIEYGLIAALLAIGLIVLFRDAGGNINSLFVRIAACLNGASTPGC